MLWGYSSKNTALSTLNSGGDYLVGEILFIKTEQTAQFPFDFDYLLPEFVFSE